MFVSAIAKQVLSSLLLAYVSNIRKYYFQSDVIFLRTTKCRLIIVMAPIEKLSWVIFSWDIPIVSAHGQNIWMWDHSFILLVSISIVAFTTRWTAIRKQRKINVFYEAEKVLESITLSLLRKSFLVYFDARLHSARKFIEWFCWNHTTIALLR